MCHSIKKLESSTKLLTETVNEVRDIERKINSLKGPKITAIKQKFKNVFAKNDGFNIMCELPTFWKGSKIVEKLRTCVSVTFLC